jgi:hypothetical protein
LQAMHGPRSAKRLERNMVGWMPVPRGEHSGSSGFEQADVVVEDGDYFVASGNGQRSTREKVSLHVNNYEGIGFADSDFLFQTKSPSTIFQTSKQHAMLLHTLGEAVDKLLPSHVAH